MPGYDPYAPLHSLKPVADDIWIVDGSEARMNVAPGVRVPFPTRMTVIRLADGSLWCHSPTEWTGALADELGAIGPVAHLVSPNRLHYAWIGQWQRHYPTATAWAAPGTRSRARAHGSDIDFDRDLGDRAEPEWESDVDQLRFRGSRFMDEIVFFHRRTRTLIVADLIENFEPARMSGGWGRVLRLSGAIDPDGKTPIDLRMTFVGRKRAARHSLQRMLAWRPERIILAHGRWYPSGGTVELARAFRWLSG